MWHDAPAGDVAISREYDDFAHWSADLPLGDGCRERVGGALADRVRRKPVIAGGDLRGEPGRGAHRAALAFVVAGGHAR
jgi:hypothetical protein